jgi:hypothetical protein
MMSTALSIEPDEAFPFAVRTTEMPPCRSRPSFGFHGRLHTFAIVGVGVLDAEGVGEGDADGDALGGDDGVGDEVEDELGAGVTASSLHSEPAAIPPQIPTTRKSMTRRDVRYLRRAVAIGL